MTDTCSAGLILLMRSLISGPDFHSCYVCQLWPIMPSNRAVTTVKVSEISLTFQSCFECILYIRVLAFMGWTSPQGWNGLGCLLQCLPYLTCVAFADAFVHVLDYSMANGPWNSFLNLLDFLKKNYSPIAPNQHRSLFTLKRCLSFINHDLLSV